MGSAYLSHQSRSSRCMYSRSAARAHKPAWALSSSGPLGSGLYGAVRRYDLGSSSPSVFQNLGYSLHLNLRFYRIKIADHIEGARLGIGERCRSQSVGCRCSIIRDQVATLACRFCCHVFQGAIKVCDEFPPARRPATAFGSQAGCMFTDIPVVALTSGDD
jgi:hypothetical protein